MQERALHLLGGADEALARAGELRARRATVEQLRADRGLQRRDATADRRMVELEPLGGGDELPAPRDCEEDADVIPIHIPPPRRVAIASLTFVTHVEQRVSRTTLRNVCKQRAAKPPRLATLANPRRRMLR